MPARRAALALALATLLAGPSHPALAQSATEFVEQLTADPGSGAGSYARNRAIVKYRDTGPAAVGECVESLLRDGRSFAEVTGGAGDSLDRLHAKFHVRSATALFRRPRPGEDPRLSALRARRQARGSGSAPMTSLRSARADGVEPPFLDHVYLLETEGDTDVEELCAEFRDDPGVVYCHPDRVVVPDHVPDDPYFASRGSWGQSYGDLWGLAQIGASSAWDRARGEGAVVAVVDTGLDTGHPDIAANLWTNPGEIPDNGIDDDANGFVDDVVGWSFSSRSNDVRDGHGHGTHVAGTIAAVMDNGIGVVGVAPASRILPVKAIRDAGSGLLSDLVQGIVYAADAGADVINNSWGTAYPLPADPALVDAVRYAHSQGAVVVASAGNSATDIGGPGLGHPPGALPETITVAASDHLDRVAGFSNFGTGIDVAAPGGDSRDATSTTLRHHNVLSLRAQGTFDGDVRRVGDDYLRLAGTSMATPHVSGLAALLLSLHPEYTVEEVRQAIRVTAEDIGAPGWDPAAGYGRIDAPEALALPSPLTALITSPSNGEYVAGEVEVRGFADGSASLAGANFASYRLEFGPGAAPTDWESILESTLGAPGERALGTWTVPPSLPDGRYTLRLVVSDDTGREFESRVAVEEDSHDPPEHPGWPQRQRRALRQLSPMMPIAADIDLDGDLEILLGPYAWHHDGSLIVHGPRGVFGNHPVEIGFIASYNGAPAVGDVDGDGRNEVVLIHAKGDFTAELLVFDEAGEMEPGWPVEIGRRGAILRNATPVLADVDGDGVREVVVAHGEVSRATSKIDVYRGDGTLLLSLSAPFVSTNLPSVGDLDGDRLPEIVMLADVGEVLIWNHDGTDYGVRRRRREIINYKIGKEERALEDRTDITAPVIGDLDRDGDAEITVVDTSATVWLVDAISGQNRPGWPQQAGCCDPSVPALVDIDGDGDLEIVLGDAEGAVHVWQHDGTYADGWPVTTSGYANTTPAIGDLDGDGSPEIVTISWDGRVYAWDARGRELRSQGWPVFTDEYYRRGFFTAMFGLGASPVIADLDGDGDREVVAYTEQIHVWDPDDLVTPPPVRTEWPMFRFDPFGSADPMRAADADLDGALNENDACADTPVDEVVDPQEGCSVSQLCDCGGERGDGWPGPEKEAALLCIEEEADRFRLDGVVSGGESGFVVATAKHHCLVEGNRGAGAAGAVALPEPGLALGLACGLAFLAAAGRRRLRP